MPQDAARPAPHESLPDGSSVPSLGERDRVRAEIRAEIAARNAYPVARRTLELMVEATVEPDEAPPGYRVVDRDGAPRSRPGAEDGLPPLTIRDLVDELQARHPALFPPPEPEPAPAAPAVEPAPSTIGTTTARVVAEQSVRAQALLAASRAHGRGLMSTAGRAWTRLRPEPKPAPPQPAPPQPAASPEPIAPPAVQEAAKPGPRPATAPGDSLRDRGRRLGGRLRVGGRRTIRFPRRRSEALTEAAARTWDGTDGLRAALGRPSVLAGIAALGLAALVATWAGRGGEEPSSVPPTRTAPVEPPSATAPSPQEQAAAPPPEEPAPPVIEEPAPAPEPVDTRTVSGPTEVIDTATLRVGGRLVRLFGVEWVRGGKSEELTRYLAGRPVTCQPVPGSEAYLCGVDGRDLSEVVLFNGGGRASPEATPDLVAAEDRARTERLGVWAR